MPETEDVHTFQLERTLLLNDAAETMGFDDTVRRAMIHVEVLVTALSRLGLAWEDIPEKFSLEGALGHTAVSTLCAMDEGFMLTVRAQHDPELRTSLLAQYVRCIEVAKPDETQTVQQTLTGLLVRSRSS